MLLNKIYYKLNVVQATDTRPEKSERKNLILSVYLTRSVYLPRIKSLPTLVGADEFFSN